MEWFDIYRRNYEDRDKDTLCDSYFAMHGGGSCALDQFFYDQRKAGNDVNSRDYYAVPDHDGRIGYVEDDNNANSIICDAYDKLTDKEEREIARTYFHMCWDDDYKSGEDYFNKYGWMTGAEDEAFRALANEVAVNGIEWLECEDDRSQFCVLQPYELVQLIDDVERCEKNGIDWRKEFEDDWKEDYDIDSYKSDPREAIPDFDDLIWMLG